MQQKAKDKEEESQRRMHNVMNKMKKELKGMTQEQQGKAIERYGLQTVKADMDAAAKPEMRPRWVGFPH